jgi:glycosyltransferase involved in cell wall biosynthesis
LLRSLLAYCRGLGVDARWLVVSGSQDFFRVTKRLHNALHGSRGDGSSLGEDARALYEAIQEENAAIVNALQRHAAVVVQKSLQEGFGLTVTEAMWKSRPVIASAVGGIQDQIQDGVHGLLVRDPSNLDAFASALRKVLSNRRLGDRLSESARARVKDRFLGLRALMQYSGLIDLITR